MPNNKDNYILYDGIWLPKDLFYIEDEKSESVSPHANFEPDSALKGKAFNASFLPSGNPKKKVLVIDADFQSKQHSERILWFGDLAALLKRLQIAGFEIFLRSQPTSQNQSNFHKLDENLSNISLLKNLSKFDEIKDYEELAKQGVAKDKLYNLKNDVATGIIKGLITISNHDVVDCISSELYCITQNIASCKKIAEAKNYYEILRYFAVSSEREQLEYLKNLTKKKLEKDFSEACSEYAKDFLEVGASKTPCQILYLG